MRDLPAVQVKPIAAVLPTGPAMQDLPAVQVKTIAVVLLHWSDGVGPTCSAGENYCNCAAPLARQCGTYLYCR